MATRYIIITVVTCSSSEVDHGLNEASSGTAVFKWYTELIRCTAHKGSELRSCVKVEMAVLGSPSLIVCTVSVDIKQH